MGVKKMKIMIIMSIAIMFFVLPSFGAETSYNCGRGHDEEWVSTTDCPLSDRTLELDIQGYYETSAEAYALAQTGLTALQSAHPGYTASLLTNITMENYTDVDGNIWMGWTARVAKCGSTISESWWYGYTYYYLNPSWTDENEDCFNDYADDDGDGMLPPYDISPDDNCPKYKIIKEVTNPAGTCTYYALVMTSQCKIYPFGDPSAEARARAGEIDVAINELNPDSMPYRDSETGECKHGAWDGDCTTIGSEFTSCDSGILPKSDYDGGGNTYNTTNITDGTGVPDQELEPSTDNTGNSTETDYLEDIVNNTKAIVDNQQTMSDQLTDIVDAINQTKDAINNTAGSGGDSNDNNPLNDQATGDLADIGDTDDIDPEDYSFGEGDLTGLDTDATGYISDIEDMVESSGLQDIIDNSGFDITEGDCSFQELVEILGEERELDFDFCPMEPQLIIIGDFLLAIAGLWYIVIIIKS